MTVLLILPHLAEALELDNRALGLMPAKLDRSPR